MKKISLIIGILLLIVGAFYTFFPHSIHISLGLGFSLTHGVHVSIGVVLLIIGGVVLWKGK